MTVCRQCGGEERGLLLIQLKSVGRAIGAYGYAPAARSSAARAPSKKKSC